MPKQPEALILAEREAARSQRELDLMFLRLLLQRRVRHVSPLLLDLAQRENLSLDRYLWRIRTSKRSASTTGALGRYAFPLTPWRYLLPFGWQSELTPLQADTLFRDAMSGRGVPVRLPSDPRGHIGISINEDQLEVEFGAGGVHIWSHGGDAFVLAHRVIPETAATGIIGTAVGRVVEHPVLTERHYPIIECRVSEPDDGKFGTTTVRFQTGRHPFEMPFASLVSQLVKRARTRCRGQNGPISDRRGRMDDL